MSRNSKIEGILEAWYNWDHSETFGRVDAKARLYELINDVIKDTNFNSEQILDHLWDDYLEYRASRYKNEKLQIAQSVARQKPG